MTDHKHEWGLVACKDTVFGLTWVIAECECGEQLHESIVESCLNACEELTAEDARYEAQNNQMLDSYYTEFGKMLMAYADKREGK